MFEHNQVTWKPEDIPKHTVINKTNAKWMFEHYYLFIVRLTDEERKKSRLTTGFKMCAEVWAQLYKPRMRK